MATPEDARQNASAQKAKERTIRDPLIGRVVDGRYTILSLLGRGGMGAVYRAHQASLERSVALKVLYGASKPEREREFQQRFFFEAATAARLSHPNTITVFDYGSEEIDEQRLFFIAMELIEGVTLSLAMKQARGPFPAVRAVHVAMQVCRSLREAHREGVVHRDLKPGNVMLLRPGDEQDDEDFVKVLDFGLAKTFLENPDENLTRAGTFLGSPRYVAPEQIEGRGVDPRADIYSLGCVLYRMIAGRVPFDGKAPVEVMLKHLHEPVPPLGVEVPEPLERLIFDTLEKKKEDRPSSMEEVISRLKLVRAVLGDHASRIIQLSDERYEERVETGDVLAAEAVAGPRPEVSDEGVSEPGPRAAQTSGIHGQPTALDARAKETMVDPSVLESTPLPQASPPPTQPVGGNDDPWVATIALDETRPTRVLGQRTEAPPSRPRTFAWGLVLGAAVAVGAVVAHQSDALSAILGPVDVEPDQPPPGPNVRAKVKVTSTPAGADVFQRAPEGERPLGKTPLTLDWQLRQGQAPRRLVIRKRGFVDADIDVQLPDGALKPPVTIDVERILQKTR